MRILLINSEYPPIGGGAGNACAHLAAEFVSQGQEVTVLTTQYDNLPSYSVHNGVRVYRIRAIRRKQDRSGAFEQGVFLITGVWSAFRLLRHWHPDVILAFFGVPSGAISLVVNLFTRIPYLVSLRGGDVPGFRPYDFSLYHRLIGPLLHHVWRHADAVVANSQGLKQLAVNFDDQVQIEVIPNGVDIKRFTSPEKRAWDNPKMLFVGRLVYQKGLDVLIRALGDLKELAWHLTLVGDGPHRAHLEGLIEAFGISERIRFAGWLDQRALLEQYEKANLFVFPSRHEGMPNAVLEAMACGLPVIASEIAGNEELVVPGETGLLVPCESPQALRTALTKLLLDPSIRMKLGMASRKRVENDYTWKQVANQYLFQLRKMTG
jgi:glycosyltransferase involved in cell wall biosynthesis